MGNQENRFTVSYFGISDIGLVRSENQDSLGKFPLEDLNLYSSKGQLFIVADGVGGHTGGKEASVTAVETISSFYFSSSLNAEEAVREAIYEANSMIYNKAQNSPQIGRMATTCSLLLLKENNGIIGHVGDSRIYKIESNRIDQLTTDHTKVLEMLREGVLTKEEADKYPSKSVLARALGADEKVKADILSGIILQNGQYFILCSDGLSKVTPQEIMNIVINNSPDVACNQLIDLAKERGGKDNITVQVVRIGIEDDYVRSAPVKKGRKNTKKVFWIISIIIFLIASGYLLKDKIPFFTSIDVTIDSSNQEIQPADNLEEKPVEEKANNLDTLIIEANIQFNKGRLEKARQLYSTVLDNDPLHLAALKGINSISESYSQRAEKLMNENRFKEAIVLLKKVAELQPENLEVIKLIKICERQLSDSSKTELKIIDSTSAKNQLK